MTVPFLDLKASYQELKADIDTAMMRVSESGWYIGGPEVATFERDFAAYCGVDHCVGVANGLDALHLGLLALGVGPGDEVIVGSNNYIATWLAVTMAGATPVPVEPDPLTHNLDVAAVAGAITSRTRAILPTHLYGSPADLDPLLTLARQHALWVVEDAAQAHGAAYRGRRIGGHGDLVAWSFYPSKNLGALGDAGAITTNSPDLAERVRVLGNYGSHVRYVNDVKGVNSRLDPHQAAVLSVKLRHLDSWNERRSTIAARYTAALHGTDIITPCAPEGGTTAWHLYVVQSPDRDGFQGFLKDHGIQTLIHYPIPPHLQKAYADMNMAPGSFPIAERLAKQVISLPIGPQLTRDDVDRVVNALIAWGAR